MGTKTATKSSIDNFFAETPDGFETQKNKAAAPLKNRKQVAVQKPLHEGRQNILHHIFAKCWAVSEGVSQAMRGDARKSNVFMGLMQKAQEVQTMICMVKYEQNMYVSGDVEFEGDYVIALDSKDNQEAGKKVKRCESMHCFTHVVSIFIANFCVIKQEVTEPYYQNYCHFMRFCRKFIFLQH